MKNRQGRLTGWIVIVASMVQGVASAQETTDVLPRGADASNVVMNCERGPVALHVAANGRLIACQYAAGRPPTKSNSMSEALIVYDLKSGRELHRMDFRTADPSRSACTPDGRYLIVIDRERVHHLDLEQGKVVRTWPIDITWAVPAISPDGLTLAVREERVISIWDLKSGECKRRLDGHPTRIRTFAFDDSGTMLLSSCSEVTRSWDLTSGKGKTLGVHDEFTSLAIDRNTNRLFATRWGGDPPSGAGCYDLRSGRRLTFLDDHDAMLTDVTTDRWYTMELGEEELIQAVQIRKLSNPGVPKYLAFDNRLKEWTRSGKGWGVPKMSLSPDKRYLLLTLARGSLCQVWNLQGIKDQDLLASHSKIKRATGSGQSPGNQKLSREQLFLNRINGIVRKANALCNEGKKDLARLEIEALVDAGRKRLQRAPKRLQKLLQECGSAYNSCLQDREKGMPLIREALEMAESGKRFDSYWESMIGDIAVEQYSKGDYQAAVATKRRIIDQRISEGKTPSSHNLAGLAFWLKIAGNTQESISLYHRAWQQDKTEWGPLHQTTRMSYDRLLKEVDEVGGWKLLEPILVKQLDENRRYMGPTHPETAEATLQLAELYGRLGKSELALTTMDQSQRILRDHVARQLPSMSETEQREFLTRRFQPSLDAALRLAVRLKQLPNAAEVSAGWILNSKGTATRALAERARIAASTSDPQVQAIAAELSETREMLSSLSLANLSSKTESDGHNETQGELNRLREQESELSWKLGLAGWTELRRDPWTSVSAIRDKIPGDSVLLELTITGMVEPQEKDAGREANVGPKNEKPQVVMWIIPPAGQGKVRMVVLCDDLMSLARPLAGFYACVNGRVPANQVANVSRQSLAAIAAQLVRPLPREVSSAKKWLVSPDHLLWLIPWAALPESDNRLVIHRHEVQYLLSGRDLLTLPSTESKSAPMIVANPDYNAGAIDGKGDSAFSPLPGTAKEAESVRPYLRDFANSEPDFYVGSDAIESVVKAAQRPKVALFSTHGFATVVADEHPLATCGLAFAGANAAIKGNGDGVLTGLEILGADYRGTELVVLSACQTALGSIRSGEGVASLRYAFQLAGARNIAATLWSIPDEVTADLMRDFFKHYSSGSTPASALRSAQLATIERLEKEGGTADPSQWAAFTIAGPPLPKVHRPPTHTTGAQVASSPRQWKSANGKFSVTAQLVSVNDQRVVLRKTSGDEIEVLLSQLHPKDREFASSSH
ncbi:CHAT domain protein [Planctomycetes bacterium CA13]|uniref:CHAT domain protein n=1 Tax=Novipirellula herctigrandis TaxID=2527986 RepID=A0A5C5ZA12_9BACT|nr:CHAT domain protein [Planctomycetes bacterium CA13]